MPSTIYQNRVEIILKQQGNYGFILKMKLLMLLMIKVSKSLKYKAQLLEVSVAEAAPNESNITLINATIKMVCY